MLIYRKRFVIGLHDSLYHNNNNNNNGNNNTSNTNNNNKLYLNTVKSEIAAGSRVYTYNKIQIIHLF